MLYLSPSDWVIHGTEVDNVPMGKWMGRCMGQ